MRGHTDRLWMVGGAFGAVVLLALAWFFLISPQRDQTQALQDETSAAQSRVNTLQARLRVLQTQNEKLAEYKAERDTIRQALPNDLELSDFLRQLQAAGEAAGVKVSGVIVGEPALAKAGGGKVYTLAVSLTANGTAVQLSKFLDQIQLVQPRAVLIGTTNLAAIDASGSVAGQSSLTLSLEVFVASVGAPTGTSSATSTASTEGTN